MLQVHQNTKSCKIRICLTSGSCLEGQFHTPAGSSDATRPFDAIRDFKGGYLLLSDVTVTEQGKTKNHKVVMVRTENISHIELPDAGWETDAGLKTQSKKVGVFT